MGNLVAIVGRPNVGKSTLFNRLTKSRSAIVSEEAGTTRDRQYGKCEWNGREFSVVDTGGWVVNSDDIFEEEIRKQVVIATEEADLLLFLVDGRLVAVIVFLQQVESRELILQPRFTWIDRRAQVNSGRDILAVGFLLHVSGLYIDVNTIR